MTLKKGKILKNESEKFTIGRLINCSFFISIQFYWEITSKPSSKSINSLFISALFPISVVYQWINKHLLLSSEYSNTVITKLEST